MIVQAVCSSLILAAIFLLEFNLDVSEMGLASNLNALLIVLGGRCSRPSSPIPARNWLLPPGF